MPSANSLNIEIDPSRRLIASPEWGEFGVVFDARSGDLWIVGNETRKALISGDLTLTQSVDMDVIDNLIAHGIIRASRTS